MVTRSGAKVWVNVRGQGQGSGQGHGEGVNAWLGSDGRWGRLEMNILFLSRTDDRIEFHSIPFHSNPFHSKQFHSISIHSIPFHSMFYPMPFFFNI